MSLSLFVCSACGEGRWQRVALWTGMCQWCAREMVDGRSRRVA